MAVKWHTVRQDLTTQLSEVGAGFTPVWEVTYMIDEGPAKGTKGLVTIPAAQYNAPTVKAAVDAIVEHNHNVASL